ncbi:MAG TPA: hypothetical protein VD967_00865 [Candidatus Paceibacterota bacterium]|nr:hypothetical protein [Candidatus Paceibacterota bacterium]
MGTTYLFFASLAAMVVMLALKDWELHRGRKPFSALRYKLDQSLRKRFAHVLSYAAYANRHTAKLLLLYALDHIHHALVVAIRKFRDSEFATLIRGRYHRFTDTLPERNSVYLNSLASHKKDEAYKLPVESADEPRS